MTYVTSDLHGYPFEKFQSLLNSVGFSDNDTLYILGDVVDKGKDGVKYLQWSLDTPNVTLLLGNHEDMLRRYEFLFDPDKEDITPYLHGEEEFRLCIWTEEGGMPTLEGLCGISAAERAELGLYLYSLPAYLKINVGGKDFLLVHSGLGEFSPEKRLDEYELYEMLWDRPKLSDEYFDDVTTVFGHTPTLFYGDQYSGKILFTDTWIDIDVGVAAGFPPVLLQLDDMQQFSCRDC